MKGRTRRQELAEFFAAYSLFMPPTRDAREAIYVSVHSRNKYWLAGTTLSERAATLKKATEELQGQLMTHRKLTGRQKLLKVRYVLLKTELEIEKQIKDRRNGSEELEIEKISPFKVCVEGLSPQPCIIPLDMLVLASWTCSQ